MTAPVEVEIIDKRFLKVRHRSSSLTVVVALKTYP